jgi:PQ loop repeat
MNPALFETIMLLCFGCAWPFSIYKTWKTKSAKGKSLFFVSILLVGYAAGILFQVFGAFNAVLYLYILNFILVGIDLLLSIRYQNT